MWEIAECGTDHEGDWLCYCSWGLLIVSQKMWEIVGCGTDPEGGCWLWHRPWGRLLTVTQTMKEIDCVNDHEGCCLCHRKCGRLLAVLQTMKEIVDCDTDHEGNCCLCHSWPWKQHITCAFWFWHCIMSILYSISLPWITDGFELSSIQNLVKQCCLTLILTSMNII